MQTKILNMVQHYTLDPAPETVLSFRPFVDFLRKRKEETNCYKHRYFAYIIDRFDNEPGSLDPIAQEDATRYAELLELIYNTLSPAIEDERHHRWAMSLPLKPVVFYSTDAYYNLVMNMATGAVRKSIAEKSATDIKKNQLEYTYSLILEKLYNIPSFFSRETVHSLADEGTGLLRYIKLSLDTRFIDIQSKRELPPITIAKLQAATVESQGAMAYLLETIPLDGFRFEGFGLVTVMDVTAKYVIEHIKNIILNRNSAENDTYYTDVIRSLKTLVGSNDIEFGLLPILQVNDKQVFIDDTFYNSKLIQSAQLSGMPAQTYTALVEDYFRHPKAVFLREITPEDEARQVHLKLLRESGVNSYALAPIYFNNSVAGVLEIYSEKKDLLDESMLTRLEPAMPLLAQLLKNNIDEFNDSVDRVIKEKFTSVQPSVQWKFNEVAWHYLRDQHLQTGTPDMEDIAFEDVYPLYGAIDIRNSTIERNAALQKDMRVQFTVLLETLQRLKDKSGFGLIDEKIFSSRQWMDKLNDDRAFVQQVELNDFLENDLTPFLLQFRDWNPELATITEDYFAAIDEKTGIANESRRELEKSMGIVISSINNYLEMMKDEIQRAYPSYFEKFRTDGVEYDIYIGQSISPDKPFTDIYLKNLRLLQLTSMSAIAKYSHALLQQLPRPVETTQLIFVHSHPIDIKFRKDEKRFDVEGSYNIRYQVVKKRIDKVSIRQSGERLTQPGKIALVYFNPKEADEYVSYIRYLQGQQLLNDDLEYLELEELQGVSGLKALRVGVKFD